jgi:hypothetical protein
MPTQLNIDDVRLLLESIRLPQLDAQEIKLVKRDRGTLITCPVFSPIFHDPSANKDKRPLLVVDLLPTAPNVTVYYSVLNNFFNATTPALDEHLNKILLDMPFKMQNFARFMRDFENNDIRIEFFDYNATKETCTQESVLFAVSECLIILNQLLLIALQLKLRELVENGSISEDEMTAKMTQATQRVHSYMKSSADTI